MDKFDRDRLKSSILGYLKSNGDGPTNRGQYKTGDQLTSYFQKFGWSTIKAAPLKREIRDIIKELRQVDREPITSKSGAGYLWTQDPVKIREFMERELIPRIADLQKTNTAFNYILTQLPTGDQFRIPGFE